MDLAGLAIKIGNALVLKGGREAYNTNEALVRLIHLALKRPSVVKKSYIFDRSRI